MSEKDKEIIRKMAEAIPKLSGEKQNYILGVAEGMAIARDMEVSAADSEQPVE